MNYFQRIQALDRGISFTQFIQEVKRYHLLWRQDLTLIAVLSGSVELSVLGKLRTLETDDIVLINRNQTFSTLANHKGCFAMFMYFDPQFFAKYLPSGPLLFNCGSNESTRGDEKFVRLRGYLASMMRHSFASGMASFLSIEANYMMFMDSLLRDFTPITKDNYVKTGADYHVPALDSIIGFINTNYRREISLGDIADIGGYNPSYVSHLFKEKVGIGFREYLTRRRLQSAVADLNHTDKPMTAVARDNGFADVKSFYLNFEKMYQKTPLQYKKQMLAGDFSKIRLQNPQSQHNYSEARVIYPNAVVEQKLDSYINLLRPGI